MSEQQPCTCETGRYLVNIGVYAAKASGDIERMEAQMESLRLALDLSETQREDAEQDRDRLREVIGDLLPLAAAHVKRGLEYGDYDPINGDWADEEYRNDSGAIERARAALGTREGES